MRAAPGLAVAAARPIAASERIDMRVALVIGQGRDLGVRKTAEDQIKLAGAAVPAAKQQPLAPVIQAVARSCRSRHPLFQSNAKNPDVVPGGFDIAMEDVDVSTFAPTKID